MDFSFKIQKKDRKTRARAGVIKTSHGEIQTPAFSPVATKASVKTLSPEDLLAAGSQVVLGNTYHLFLRPGSAIIKKFGGLGPFMGWDGPTITDSGGYQVSCLWPPARRAFTEPAGSMNRKSGPEGEVEENIGKVVKITDAGATFSSYIDGSIHILTPEKSLETQKSLGADIIMAFDQPLGSDYSKEEKEKAFTRTLKWEERSFMHWKKIKSSQALFGIVQGDLDKDLRRKSLEFILSMGFPGIAIGGESIGSNPEITAKSMELVMDLLPDDKPVHALGLGGGPEGIFAGVSRGVDLFDNTGITRMARTGLLFIYPQDGGTRKNKYRVDIKRKGYYDKMRPISKSCDCFACRNFSSAYIHHLLVSGELLGLRLASIHNVTYINSLMGIIRGNIQNGDFAELKKFWLKG